MKYTDDHGNVCVHLVDRPDVVSRFFADSNLVDKHNQVQQDELGLEKCWVMLNPYFRLTTMIVGIHVVDCWKLAAYHKLIKQDEMGISKFAGILGLQLITLAKTLSALDDENIQILPSVVTVGSGRSEHNTSSVSNSASNPDEATVVRSLIDANGCTHHQVKYPVTVNRKGTKKYTKTRACKLCEDSRKLTGYYCHLCNLSFCCPTKLGDRDCFAAHVELIRRSREAV